MTSPSTHPIADVTTHIDRLRRLPAHEDASRRTLFALRTPTFVARAPGRLDVMGGIGDYSGSLVLEMPIAEAAFAAVQYSDKPGVLVASLGQLESDTTRVAAISPQQWSQLQHTDYRTIGEELRGDSNEAWATYVLGSVLTLLRETGTLPPGGLRVLIHSQVPEGKGVSSSAAIEVATMRAMAGLLKIDLRGEELARLCQLAENRIVGAPCGIMDQITSALGRPNELLALRCRPALIEGFVPLPKEIAFWGIDSGIRHAVTGSDYTSVRCGAFMGYRIIAEAAGLKAEPVPTQLGVLEIDDPKWQGYLANITRAEFNDRFASIIPEQLLGSDFLARYFGTTDSVTRVDPARSYAVRSPTLHPIEENARAEQFRALLQAPITDQSLSAMGQLMAASHASYSACGLGSQGTDLIAELVQNAAPTSGLYGAKITGGGSGGTVAILGRADAGPTVDYIAQKYSELTGRQSHVFRGSSPGAYHTPVMEVII